jgi:hypothetical protein
MERQQNAIDPDGRRQLKAGNAAATNYRNGNPVLY